MNEFVKYSSLENHYQGRFIAKIENTGNDYGTWVATEKVHGANYAFHFDGTELKVAKRTAFIEEGEKFYDHIPVKERYTQAIYKMWKALSFDGINGPKSLVVYGELFGGNYGGVTTGSSKVQKEVDYLHYQDFIMFDIVVNGRFMDWDFVVDMGRRFEIPVVPEIGRGTFHQMLELNNHFVTVVPEMYGLDPLADNIGEGLVIRPIDSRFLIDGKRVIIKSKNAKFSEKKDRADTKPKPKVVMSLGECIVLDEICKYLNENRINAVVSKIGTVTGKEFGKVLGMFVQDALNDYCTDNECNVRKEHGERWGVLQKEVQNAAIAELRKVWTDLIEE